MKPDVTGPVVSHQAFDSYRIRHDTRTPRKTGPDATPTGATVTSFGAPGTAATVPAASERSDPRARYTPSQAIAAQKEAERRKYLAANRAPERAALPSVASTASGVDSSSGPQNPEDLARRAEDNRRRLAAIDDKIAAGLASIKEAFAMASPHDDGNTKEKLRQILHALEHTRSMNKLQGR